MKVSDIVPTTVSVPTSTRVVTEIVEGATQRQRVPLSKLRQFINLKDFDNSVLDQVTVRENKLTTPVAAEETKTERPLLHGFSRRRPDIIITTTARTTPAFLAKRRNRFRSTTEAVQVTSKGRFVPSRGRNKTNEINMNGKIAPQLDVKEDTAPEIIDNEFNQISTESAVTRGRYNVRNRFTFNRRTTTTTTERTSSESPEKSKDQEDEIFIEGNSRDTNIIRKPVYKPRFASRRRPTSTEVVTESSSGSESSSLPSTVKGTSSTPVVLNDEVLGPIEKGYSADFSTISGFVTTELPLTTFSTTEGISSLLREEEQIGTGIPLIEEINQIINSSAALEKTSQTGIILSSNAVAFTTENSMVSEKATNNKYVPLPVIHPTEINNMVSQNEGSTVLPVTGSGNVKFRPRYIHGRKYINLRNGSSTENNLREFIEDGADGRKKIILRRRKPTTESNLLSNFPESNPVNNRTNIIRRKRPLNEEKLTPPRSDTKTTHEIPHKVQRGRVKFNTVQNDDPTVVDDSIALSSKDSTRTRIQESLNTTEPGSKRKRVIIRGRKKFIRDEDFKNSSNIAESKLKTPHYYTEKSPEVIVRNVSNSILNNTHDDVKQRNKVRKVLLRRKTTQGEDLAVEESMSPGKGDKFKKHHFETDVSSRKEIDITSTDDLEIDFSEDILQTSKGEQEV